MLGFAVLDIQSQTQKSSEKETWKHEWTNTDLLVQGAQKGFKMGSLTPPTIYENPNMDLEIPFVVRSQASQNPRKKPQDAKVEAPSMPNDRFGYKKLKIHLQQCQESAILKQWAMVGGGRQKA